ncbi:MAG: ADP-ribosylglycohydrolase family protein, partial [Candidatus Aminicenantes bacterium]|nr:ADP-ribosylglycohydrolase family protein [Candidatus Aminicenantes bacterium]
MVSPAKALRPAVILGTLGLFIAALSGPASQSRKISRDVLLDKIKGGWAGQVIGCTFGGPTEFQYRGTFIPDEQPLGWNEAAIPEAFAKSPGLFDDVYMELTFLEVLAKKGLDASAAELARPFAEAPFPLWHANQAARWNILNGLLPPQSGHWLNNPHADDIDFQIEADFIGLVSPGMVNAASRLSDRVGHIMNSGDGWYGGVYIAAMYALAFTTDDVGRIVREALRAIPPESDFARCLADVVRWHAESPADWRETWFKVLKTWGRDVGCPEGVFSSFNIDAKTNAAWVVLGLLYGNGDFDRTLSVSTRCGDDSDCNPASAGGILGTVLGRSRIPPAWIKGVEDVEAEKFPYTSLSLIEACDLTFELALDSIRRQGGR